MLFKLEVVTIVLQPIVPVLLRFPLIVSKYIHLFALLQIFPLLMQQFSSEKQAAYVWQFICSIPVTLLEDFLPWILSFLSSEERVEFMHCIDKVVPKEKLLQEVNSDWSSQ